MSLGRDQTRHVDRPDQLRALADPVRVAILRRLMSSPATLTQLGAAFSRHPAWIRHHVKQLEIAGLVELSETRKVGGYTEKYYRAAARSFAVTAMILPEPGERGLVVIVGSDDPALRLLARSARTDARGPDVLTLPTGSLEGLIALRQGLGDAAGCHLLDPETGEYNLPFARRIFPGRTLVFVSFTRREQGLMVAAGNPLGLCSIDDVAAAGVRFANRNDGSGTRIWIDRQLVERGLSPAALLGYEEQVATHAEVAAAVAAGTAGAGVGVRAAATAAGIDFVPLFEERYDLVVPAERHETPAVQSVLRRLRGRGFRRAVRELGGYSTAHTGEERVVAA